MAYTTIMQKKADKVNETILATLKSLTDAITTMTLRCIDMQKNGQKTDSIKEVMDAMLSAQVQLMSQLGIVQDLKHENQKLIAAQFKMLDRIDELEKELKTMSDFDVG